MGNIFRQTATIAATADFTGAEFSVFPPKPETRLRVVSVALKMGSESKTWAVLKTFKNAAGSTISVKVAQSLDENGVPGANLDTDVYLNEAELAIDLLAGEQVQILTTDATAAMNAEIMYEVIDNTPTQRIHDPRYTM